MKNIVWLETLGGRPSNGAGTVCIELYFWSFYQHHKVQFSSIKLRILKVRSILCTYISNSGLVSMGFKEPITFHPKTRKLTTYLSIKTNDKVPE